MTLSNPSWIERWRGEHSALRAFAAKTNSNPLYRKIIARDAEIVSPVREEHFGK